MMNVFGNQEGNMEKWDDDDDGKKWDSKKLDRKVEKIWLQVKN